MSQVDDDAAGDRLALLDWKRRVFALYAAVRLAADPAEAWVGWRAGRDELFATHPQSPLAAAARANFTGLDYFPYEPGLRVEAKVASAPRAPVRIACSGEQPFDGERFAEARFRLGGLAHSLELYWLSGYAGGLFVPFADETSGGESYGGGRYLLDTVKGSDLGMVSERLVLDFNFAYNPSCYYDPRWVCPLAPAANRLESAIRAGERLHADPC